MKRYRIHRITTPDYTSIDDLSREPVRTFADLDDIDDFLRTFVSPAFGVAIVDDKEGTIDWGCEEITDYRGNPIREREPRHALGCMCADCAGAELTTDND